MINVNVECVGGIPQALKAMRLSFKSSSKSDEIVSEYIGDKYYHANAEDMLLLKNLVVKGESHSKVLRMIQVWVDITLPRYIWSEFDTYKVGTTTMSESTVHKLKSDIKNGRIGINDFEAENTRSMEWIHLWLKYISSFENIDEVPIEFIKQTLPESFLQRRMVNLNYQVLRHMYFDRRGHRLETWKIFLNKILKQLPFNELITIESV